FQVFIVKFSRNCKTRYWTVSNIENNPVPVLQDLNGVHKRGLIKQDDPLGPSNNLIRIKCPFNQIIVFSSANSLSPFQKDFGILTAFLNHDLAGQQVNADVFFPFGLDTE